MCYYTKVHSPLGDILLETEDGQRLSGSWFVGQKYLKAIPDDDVWTDELPVFQESSRWLHIYFSGEQPSFHVKLDPKGTEFQMIIWSLLLQIPYGQTTTYGALAKLAASTMGRTAMSARAVGNAVGHNPISLFVPCHRVLGSGEKLTGYAGGVERKDFLLSLERSVVDVDNELHCISGVCAKMM